MRILLCTLLLAGAAAAQESATARLEGPFSLADYPLSLGERPLVLPNLVVQATPYFGYAKTVHENVTDVGVGLAVGLANTWEIAASTGFNVDPYGEWGKIVSGTVTVLAYDSRDLDVAPTLTAPFYFASGQDFFQSGIVGATTRYRLTHQLYVYGLRNLINFQTSGQFSMGLNGSVGVGIDPIRNVSIEVGTTLVHLAVTGDFEKTLWFGADYVPAEALVNVAINRQFDVYGAMVVPDFKNGFDAVAVLAGINARL